MEVNLRKVLDNTGLGYKWQNKQGQNVKVIFRNVALRCNEIQQQTN